MNEDVPIRPAATVILVRNGAPGDAKLGTLETLLVQRSSELAFHGGSWVFPGGRIDDEDFVPQERGTSDRERGDIESAARNAAVREAREEAGLVIHPTSLAPWAHWTTPPGRSRRFATWFYLAPAPEGSDDVVTDGSEILDHRWCTPAAALEARSRGEIELPAPTFVSLLRLATSSTAPAALAHARTYPYLHFAPRPVTLDGGLVTIYDGDAAYDASFGTRIDQPGPRHRLNMVGKDWRYENDLLEGRATG